MKSKKLMNCEICNKKTKTLHLKEGKYLCWDCYRKKGILSTSSRMPKISLKKALNRVYEVKAYKGKNGNLNVQLPVPQILIGHKLKIILYDERRKEEKTDKGREGRTNKRVIQNKD